MKRGRHGGSEEQMLVGEVAGRDTKAGTIGVSTCTLHSTWTINIQISFTFSCTGMML